MHKEIINFVDYNGVPRTGEYFFNLSDAELIEMEMSVNGGYAELLTRISMTSDMPSLIAIFKEIIHKSYGERDIDGVHFRKNEKILADFTSTEAYSILFTKLASDSKAAARFVNGIIPEHRKQALAQQAQNNMNGIAAAASATIPTPVYATPNVANGVNPTAPMTNVAPMPVNYQPAYGQPVVQTEGVAVMSAESMPTNTQN